MAAGRCLSLWCVRGGGCDGMGLDGIQAGAAGASPSWDDFAGAKIHPRGWGTPWDAAASAGSSLPLPKPFRDFSKSHSVARGRGGVTPAPPSTAPRSGGTRSMTDIITPAKANPGWPRLLGCAPRKAVFPCEDEAMNILWPRRIFLSGGCCMNYGKVGRRRRVLLAGVGSELEAALGFTSGSFPRVQCPSFPTTAATRACCRSLWCKSIPLWGSLCPPAEQVGACRVLARGWMWDGCSAARLEVCEGGTAASLGTWRAQARNGALPCFLPSPHAWMGA